MTSCLKLLTLLIWKSHVNEINRNFEGDVNPTFYLNIKIRRSPFPAGFFILASDSELVSLILSSSPHLANKNSANSLLLFDLKPSSVFTLFQITNVVSFNRMALFFSSLQGLPRFGGKPTKDDAIFDISKNSCQLGARPQSTLVERDPLISIYQIWNKIGEIRFCKFFLTNFLSAPHEDLRCLWNMQILSNFNQLLQLKSAFMISRTFWNSSTFAFQIRTF